MLVIMLAQGLSGCAPSALSAEQVAAAALPTRLSPTATLAITPLPTRPLYPPGQLVDYTAQMGDTLPALAARFNSTVREIRTANPGIPADVTTMPPGMPMRIPIYYQPFWGSPYEIIPDSLFINGPAQVGFDTVAFVNTQPGWFKDYSFFTGESRHSGGELVAQLATDWSISPRLLLALIEFQTGALSQPQAPDWDDGYSLGFTDPLSPGLYRQLLIAVDKLNVSYYSWREGTLKEFNLQDGRLQRLDPWLNASSAALQAYFAQVDSPEVYNQAVSANGLARTYKILFGDPWANVAPHIPVNLHQPDLRLPFSAGETWSFTGGPHTGYGKGEPLSAIDFAPGTLSGGCGFSNQYATALGDGVIVRTGLAEAVLDLDGDGDERTGWVIYYLHLASNSMVKMGARLKAGDALGHPSCEGGEATGTHVHIARKYNGEWIPAYGVLAFNLEGWVVSGDGEAYVGSMAKGGSVIRACTCSDHASHITAGQ
jgi:LasA protease